VKRVFAFLAVAVLLGGVAYLAGTSTAQVPGAAPAAAPRKPSGKVAVFNVAKVMKEYQRWNYFAGIMNQKRAGAAGELVKLRNDIAQWQEKLQSEKVEAKRDEIVRTVTALQRQFEDKEKVVRKQLDDESAQYLKNLFAEIQTAVKAIVEANDFDVVMAYPDATTVEETQSPMYYDLKMRPPAAMPFYVAPSSDMSDVLIATLNKNFPAPGPIPGTPVTPGAPGAPGAVNQTGGTVPQPGAVRP
jgi:Skp family chaperone for outer membrane proteins